MVRLYQLSTLIFERDDIKFKINFKMDKLESVFQMDWTVGAAQLTTVGGNLGVYGRLSLQW